MSQFTPFQAPHVLVTITENGSSRSFVPGGQLATAILSEYSRISHSSDRQTRNQQKEGEGHKREASRNQGSKPDVAKSQDKATVNKKPSDKDPKAVEKTKDEKKGDNPSFTVLNVSWEKLRDPIYPIVLNRFPKSELPAIGVLLVAPEPSDPTESTPNDIFKYVISSSKWVMPLPADTYASFVMVLGSVVAGLKAKSMSPRFTELLCLSTEAFLYNLVSKEISFSSGFKLELSCDPSRIKTQLETVKGRKVIDPETWTSTRLLVFPMGDDHFAFLGKEGLASSGDNIYCTPISDGENPHVKISAAARSVNGHTKKSIIAILDGEYDVRGFKASVGDDQPKPAQQQVSSAPISLLDSEWQQWATYLGLDQIETSSKMLSAAKARGMTIRDYFDVFWSEQKSLGYNVSMTQAANLGRIKAVASMQRSQGGGGSSSAGSSSSSNVSGGGSAQKVNSTPP